MGEKIGKFMKEKMMNMQQSFSSIKEIKVFGREIFFNKFFSFFNNSLVNSLEKKT